MQPELRAALVKAIDQRTTQAEEQVRSTQELLHL